MTDGIRVETFVRASAQAAFDCFVVPQRLTAFWLSSASAPLAAGARVRWEFLVPGATDEVEVTTFEPARRLAVRSSDGSTIVWTFDPRNVAGVGGTVVTVEQTNMPGAEKERLETAEGFAYVLADMKTLLEQGKAAGIVRDKAALLSAK
ncbi:MAG: SRPBCC domain-containing protein [Labilithrix sp.]|nr:SRPBCC domain-containing protein [Labilithrix sp.]MCW5810211.1 SRPBCC domain-containing protein [Labilithrix sp.]